MEGKPLDMAERCLEILLREKLPGCAVVSGTASHMARRHGFHRGSGRRTM